METSSFHVLAVWCFPFNDPIPIPWINAGFLTPRAFQIHEVARSPVNPVISILGLVWRREDWRRCGNKIQKSPKQLHRMGQEIVHHYS